MHGNVSKQDHQALPVLQLALDPVRKIWLPEMANGNFTVLMSSAPLTDITVNSKL